MQISETTSRRISELHAHPRNAEVYGHEMIDKNLVESIKKHGLLEPIMIRPDGTILSGHRRVGAAKEAGLSEVPVRLVDIEDDLDELELVIHSNKQRKKTNIQLAREAQVLKAAETERARRRMSDGGKGGLKGQKNGSDLGQARDIVGMELGMSGPQVDKLVQVAETIDHLESLGRSAEARELETILNQESVRAAHNSELVQTYRQNMRESQDAVPANVRGVSKPQSSILLDDWKTMSDDEKADTLEYSGDITGRMNRQTTSSIDWAAWSWNPITGCQHNCVYCYAADQAPRVYPHVGFHPTFWPGRLHMPAKTPVPDKASEDLRYRNVFTCSMADLFGNWVPQEWIDAVLDVMRAQNQWTYLVLTKFPQRLSTLDWPENTWVGATVDMQSRVDLTMRRFSKVKSESNAGITWLSLEPLLEPLEFESLEMFDWVVVGGASATRATPAWQPPHSWVERLTEQARRDGCKVYHKENLGYRPQEYPGFQPRDEKRAPDVFFKPRNTVDEHPDPA